jgi:hypothetical protein
MPYRGQQRRAGVGEASQTVFAQLPQVENIAGIQTASAQKRRG